MDANSADGGAPVRPKPLGSRAWGLAWGFVGSVVYLVLYFARVPVMVAGRLLSGPLMLGAVVWGFIKGWTSLPALSLGGAALVLFLLMYTYDSILLALAPASVSLES